MGQKCKRRSLGGRLNFYVLAGVLVLGAVLALVLTRTKSAGITYSDDYVWRQEVPSMLQFAYYDISEWEKKLPDSGKLKNSDVAELLRLLHLEEYILVPEDNGTISREEWFAVYDEIVSILDDEETVRRRDVLLLSWEDGAVTTSEGVLSVSEFLAGQKEKYLEPMHTYELYIQEDRLLGIAGRDNKEVVIPNGYITSSGDGELHFLSGDQILAIPADIQEDLAGVVADISVQKGNVTRIAKKEEKITGKLLSVSDTHMEIAGYGQVALDPALKLYSLQGDVQEATMDQLILENMDITFVVAEGQVSAVLLEQAAVMVNIRVLLLNDGGIFRGDVGITSDAPLVVEHHQNAGTLPAGTVITASAMPDAFEGSWLAVRPEDGAAPLYLTDAQGNRISLGYSGTLEVRRYPEGFAVVNVVDLENYVKGVLTSEVPSNFGFEALCAQAVCARSYGYMQLSGSGYSQYGAHVDDSVNYQVYNKQQPSEQALQAADATRGEVLSFQGEIVETYYYSTSYGHTGDYQAWNLDPDVYGYLAGDWLRSAPAEVDLSDEASFAAYIQQPDPECYEQDIRYFRWNTVLRPQDTQDSVMQTIRARKSIQPEAIQYYSKDLTKELDSPSGMGALENITVGGRNSSGVILELQLWYENGMVRVTSEYNIRAILGAAASDVSYQDGSSGSVTLLPSAYISITKLEDGNYQVYGGGYGHGIGMSQNGADQLAQRGWKYRDILNFFYRGTEITSCISE